VHELVPTFVRLIRGEGKVRNGAHQRPLRPFL
jgi:hypothetical protein